MARNARINPVFEQNPQFVDAQTHVRMADSLVDRAQAWVCDNGEKPISRSTLFRRAKQWINARCQECDEPYYVNDEYAARGARPDGDNYASFSHNPPKQGEIKPDCTLRVSEYDLDLTNSLEDLELSAKERARNIEAYEKPGVAREVEAVQEYLIYHMIGDDISPEDRIELRKIEKRLMSIKGLADNMWYLPLASIVALGSRVKEKGGKRSRRQFVLNGNAIDYPCSRTGMIFRPKSKLRLCQSGNKGGYPFSLPDHKGKPIVFEATPEFVERTVAHVLGIDTDDVKITEFQHQNDRAQRWQREDNIRRAAKNAGRQIQPKAPVLLFPELPRHYGQAPQVQALRKPARPATPSTTAKQLPLFASGD